MRIAWVLAGGLHPSGREQITPAILHLLARLAERHDVHAFAVRHLPDAASYTLRGIHVHDLGYPRRSGSLGRLREWRAVATALRTHGPFDVVHGYQADPGVLAALAGRSLRLPSVVTCDSGEFVALPDIGYGMQRSARTRGLVRTACGLASRVHVATAFMASLAGACGCRALRMPIGVEVGLFAAAESRDDGPPWTLLNVASLNRVKDHRTLLDAVALASHQVDVRLQVVGEDTLGGDAAAYAAELQITGLVTFHGYRPFDVLPAFYRDAHLYVQSSRHEAAGAVLMEAAAAGLPIVGTRVGYAADWAPDAAVAVPPGDAPALARAIVETLHDRALRTRLAAAARAFALAHDAAWTSAQLERLYEEECAR